MDSKLISFFRKTSWLKYNSFTRFLFYAVLIITSLATSLDVLAKNKSKAAINIGTCTELQNMNANLSGQYVLTNDIDCSGVNFSPVGGQSTPFTGSLDGAGHKILNLSIQSVNDNVGLLGYATNFSISRLTLQNVQVSGRDRTGALVGSAYANAIISNVEAQGKVISNNGGSYIGGLIGYLYNSPNGITDSSASVNVEGLVSSTSSKLGGLVGSAYQSSITRCHATGSVTGVGTEIGGLVGSFFSGSIIDSYATGTVTNSIGNMAGGLVGSLSTASNINHSYATGKILGNVTVGGLVGWMDNSNSIYNSYATGSVNGSDKIGGLIASVTGSNNTIGNSYAIGFVSGNTNIGGLIGSASSLNIINSYWDTQTSGQLTSVGGTGKTTTEMYQQGTYTNWDFTSVWNINEGKSYPWLRSTNQPIQTCAALQAISQNLNGSYQLVTDVDCKNVVFSSIGSYSQPFTGSFDGNNHTINNLTIQKDGQPYVGLFSVTQGARITDLGLKDVNILGQKMTGALVGYAFGGTQIANVSVDGTVGSNTTAEYVGGLAGVLYDGSIDRSSAAVTVNAPLSNDVGGLLGQNNSQVSNSFSLGTVMGSTEVGGLAGLNSGTITNVYSAGKVIGGNSLGGLIGANNSGTVTGSYWDTQISGQSNSAGGTGKLTAEMYKQGTYTNWDFINLWSIFDGYSYPWLKNQVTKVQHTH